MEKKLYSIGEAARIANVSNKTLRYYERIGLVVPDEINEKNGYRYYSENNLQNLSIIKYYKQMGYTLTEIKEMKNTQKDDFNKIIVNFQDKIRELEKKELEIKNSLKAINDWYKLIKESKIVKGLKFQNINIKYLKKKKYIYKEFDFDYDYRTKLLNIDWVKYLEQIENEITGPVILKFDNFNDKANGESKKVIIMQEPVKKIEDKYTYETPGGLYVSIYHIGHFNNIFLTYNRINAWAKENNIELLPYSFERYVTDYWTTNNSDDFAVEILIPIKNNEVL